MSKSGGRGASAFAGLGLTSSWSVSTALTKWRRNNQYRQGWAVWCALGIDHEIRKCRRRWTTQDRIKEIRQLQKTLSPDEALVLSASVRSGIHRRAPARILRTLSRRAPARFLTNVNGVGFRLAATLTARLISDSSGKPFPFGRPRSRLAL
jgi:hypothetical protein